MRLKIRSMFDVIVGIGMAILSTFGIPLISYYLIGNIDLGYGVVAISGYIAWIVLWFVVWVLVDGVFDRVSIKFIIDSIIFIKNRK